MAKLWIREYRARASAEQGREIQVAAEPGADQAPVTFSSTAQSAAFASTTTFVALIADAAFHYVVGTNPSATTDALKIPANTLIHIGVRAGQKVAAIAAV